VLIYVALFCVCVCVCVCLLRQDEIVLMRMKHEEYNEEGEEEMFYFK